jgi:hypothetical protein
MVGDGSGRFDMKEYEGERIGRGKFVCLVASSLEVFVYRQSPLYES